MAKAAVKYYEENREFTGMEDCAEKAELVMSRMENPYNLTDENRQMYTEWLEKTGPKVVPEFIDANKVSAFPLLVRHRVIRKANINKMVDYAQEKRRMDILSFLLNAGNDFRMHPKTMDIAPKFKPGSLPAEQKLPDYDSVKPGQIVWMGSTPMPWQVLDKKEGRLQLISKYAFDCKAYHNTFYKRSWNDCSLGKWANEEFYPRFFTDMDKQVIQPVYIDNNENLYTEKTENTKENMLYPLSKEEAERYFSTNESRRARVTAAGRSRIMWQSFGTYAHWWLRTQSPDSVGQSHVLSNGDISLHGGVMVSNSFAQFYDHFGVRPAIQIKLK